MLEKRHKGTFSNQHLLDHENTQKQNLFVKRRFGVVAMPTTHRLFGTGAWRGGLKAGCASADGDSECLCVTMSVHLSRSGASTPSPPPWCHPHNREEQAFLCGPSASSEPSDGSLFTSSLLGGQGCCCHLRFQQDLKTKHPTWRIISTT